MGAKEDIVGHSQLQRSDELLVSMVHTVNTQNAAISITVSCGGQLVSGRLAPARDYLVAFRETIVDAAQRHGEEIPDQALAKNDSPESAISGRQSREPQYIHIKDATIWPTSGVSIACGWWRGKLSAVDGFFIGELSRST
jgi:hypothetical protein